MSYPFRMLNNKDPTVLRNLERARSLRQQQTSGEKALWKELRAKRFHGHKFRRQVPIGPFIVDFLCAEMKLIIEIDGDSHWEPGVQEYDRGRETYLRAQGFEILRFGNRETLHSMESVLERIRLSYPSPHGRGQENGTIILTAPSRSAARSSGRRPEPASWWRRSPCES